MCASQMDQGAQDCRLPVCGQASQLASPGFTRVSAEPCTRSTPLIPSSQDGAGDLIGTRN